MTVIVWLHASDIASSSPLAAERHVVRLKHPRDYGDPHTPQELKSLATPPGSRFPGTYMKDMVNGVAKLGYVWETRCFAVDSAGFAAGLPELKRSIVEGRPVMVGLYDPPIGHVAVLIGIDESGRRLAFLDRTSHFQVVVR